MANETRTGMFLFSSLVSLHLGIPNYQLEAGLDGADTRRCPRKGLMRLFSIIPKEQQVLPFSCHMGIKLSSKNRAGKEG